MEDQGYAMKIFLGQDNMSAIKQEVNSWKSCGKKSRHMNVRYFLIKDRVARGEIQIDHCPAAEMDGDYFSKPLQGALFRKFRNRIMNLEESDPMGGVRGPSKLKVETKALEAPLSPRSVLDVRQSLDVRQDAGSQRELEPVRRIQDRIPLIPARRTGLEVRWAASVRSQARPTNKKAATFNVGRLRTTNVKIANNNMRRIKTSS